jgi:hypothetical protein
MVSSHSKLPLLPSWDNISILIDDLGLNIWMNLSNWRNFVLQWSLHERLERNGACLSLSVAICDVLQIHLFNNPLHQRFRTKRGSNNASP